MRTKPKNPYTQAAITLGSVALAAIPESIVTHPLVLLYNQIQTKGDPSIKNAVKRQAQLGLRNSLKSFPPFLANRVLTRTTGLGSGYAAKGYSPLEKAAFAAGIETSVTNGSVTQYRLAGIYPKAILNQNKASVRDAKKSMFKIHLSKNLVTYTGVFELRHHLGPILQKNTELSETQSYALATGIAAASVQPVTSWIDTVMTTTGIGAYKAGVAGLKPPTFFETINQVRQYPAATHATIMLARMGIFCFTYGFVDVCAHKISEELETRVMKRPF